MNSQRPMWWKESVVYQVYWRSFYDTNADGYGDIAGLTQRLDYIRDLGIDIIWLNPIYESPDKDNGYDISEYYKIMQKAGTMAEFDELLDQTHRRGMKLIMDLVVNHTSNLHPWFQESASSTSNPKRDWYIWRDPRDGREPNNWRSYFTPSAWKYDARAGQYYMHSFAEEQPDLNWANPEVRQAIYQMMRFWLDKGIDGFRLDAIALLAKQDGFPDAVHPSNLDYLANQPKVHEYIREMNREVLCHYNGFTVGEIAFVKPEEGLKYVAEDGNELDSLFHFEILDDMATWDLSRFREIQQRWYDGLWERGWNSQVLNNHDHTRQVTRYGNDGVYREQSAKLLATMIHTLPGTPYVYQGEEIGMTGMRFDSVDGYRDIAFHNHYQEALRQGENPEDILKRLAPLARDNSRTPMQWDTSRQAGFTEGEPWIQVNPNYSQINVVDQLGDPTSVLAYYRKLIALRRSNPVMIYGEYEDLLPQHDSLYVYRRVLDTVEWLVILNHSTQDQTLAWPARYRECDTKIVIANYEGVETGAGAPGMTLRPYEARVYSVATSRS